MEISSNNIPTPSSIQESYSQKFGYLLGKKFQQLHSLFEKKSEPFQQKASQSIEKIVSIDPKKKNKMLIGGSLFVGSIAALSVSGAYPVVFGVAALGILLFKVTNTPSWKQERNQLAQNIHEHYQSNEIDLSSFFNDYIKSKKNSDLKYIHDKPSVILNEYKNKSIDSILKNSSFSQYPKTEINKNLKFIALGSVVALAGVVTSPFLIGLGGAFAVKSLVKILGQKISFSKTSKQTNNIIQDLLKQYKIDSKNIDLEHAEKLLPGISKVIELEQNGFKLQKRDMVKILDIYRNNKTQNSNTPNKP